MCLEEVWFEAEWSGVNWLRTVPSGCPMVTQHSVSRFHNRHANCTQRHNYQLLKDDSVA